MGQVGSIDRNNGVASPISISNGLLLRSIHLTSDSKVIKIDNDGEDQNGLIKLPREPLSEFLQNDNLEEYPFLLKCSNQGDLVLKFALSNELLDDFNSMNNLNNFPVFHNLKVVISNGSKIFQDEILARMVQINNNKSTNDNNVININTSKNQFDITLDLNKLNHYKGKIYITLFGNNEKVFKMSLFLEGEEEKQVTLPIQTNNEDQSPKAESRKSPSPSETFEDPQYEFISDGPTFRNKMSEIEENLSNFKTLLKNIIKKTQALEESERNSAITRSNLCSSLSDLNNYSSIVNNVVLKDLINDLIPILTEKSTQNINDANLIMKNLTTPLLVFYNSDLKLLQQKKKIYADQSSEFYTWMSKYLETNHQSDSDEENKDGELLLKRLNFEQNRLEYFNYLNEFRNGYLIRNLIYNLAIFLQKINPVENQQSIDKDTSKAFFYYRNFGNYKSEQTKFKQKLNSIKNYQDLSNLISVPTVQQSPLTSSTTIDRPKPISKDSSKVFKDGNLHTLGSQDTKGWQNLYVVLNNNLLTEFVESKGSRTQKSEPIDLTFSCIKKIDSISNRKYCFEIITPSNIKRIFETSSESEREAWLKALNMAIAVKASDNQYSRRPSLRTPQRSKSTISRSRDDINLVKSTKRPSSSVRKSSYTPGVENPIPSTPLEIVQDIDQSNRLCCDCGSNKGVEWISINLLIVVCIDCSGVHRSLGTHITKIRSLVLDNKSFKSRESVELLYHVSNSFANSYWEGSLAIKDKISPLSKPEERKQFILAKYQEKKFMIHEPSFKPNDSLIRGIHNNNVPMILKSLAMGADYNMVVVKSLDGLKLELTIFEYSLTHFHGTVDDPIFDISTILLLNNTPCGKKVTDNLPLGPRQIEFWKAKINQYHQSPTVSTSSEQSNPHKPSMTRSRSIRKSLSLKNITHSDKSKREKEPKDRSNRTSRLRFPKLK